MATVGIIPNPHSGKDIRRLTAKASIVGNQDKVNIISRVFAGLYMSGVSKVKVMPDLYDISKQAVHRVRTQFPEFIYKIEYLDMELSNSDSDSIRAAKLMSTNNIGCIVVLGGDGTTRIVAKGCGEIPLLPLSAGTNNVIPYLIDGSIAGLCAGYIASLDMSQRNSLCRQHKRIEVWINGKMVDIALIDLAVSVGSFTGARSIWDLSELRQIVVTSASPLNIGLSAIIGILYPISEQDDFGAMAIVNPKSHPYYHSIAPIGPGLIRKITLSQIEKIELGNAYEIVSERPVVLSLDGERELVLQDKDIAHIVLNRNGPWIIDVKKAMLEAMSRRFFEYR
jgi:predicted polyphosphate/ATP-dependent NAD kinase